MKKNCLIIYVLNLMDLLSTLFILSLGGQELNPLLQNPAFMVFYKVVVVGLLCWFLSVMESTFAYKASKWVIGVYSILMAWQIVVLLSF